MALANTRSTNPAIREVTRGLFAARDAQILRVVAMVDAMPDRGAADQLIAPLRPRLARLRPPRPLRLARLLFLPLDPLIVPATRWRLNQPAIPRTAIPLLAASVETALGAMGAKIAAMIEGRTTDDHALIDEAGGLLWKHASRVLKEAELPADWETTGLTPQAHRPLSRRIGALLFQAERLRHMAEDAGEGLVPPEPPDVRTLLRVGMEQEPDAQPMLIALLLARIPESGPVLLQVATELGQSGGSTLRHASGQAADMLLDQLEAPGGAEGQLGGQNLTEAGATVRRLTSLVGALDGEMLSAERRGRLHGIKQRIKTECLSLFTERLETDLIEPLRARGAEATGEAWELETAARRLRVLETEARRAGDDKAYDAQLGQAADMVREMIDQGGLDRIGGLRLMEIVAGPEVALALLGEEV